MHLFKPVNILLVISPYLVFGAFLLIQKKQNGWYFFPFHLDNIATNLSDYWSNAAGLFNSCSLPVWAQVLAVQFRGSGNYSYSEEWFPAEPADIIVRVVCYCIRRV